MRLIQHRQALANALARLTPAAGPTITPPKKQRPQKTNVSRKVSCFVDLA